MIYPHLKDDPLRSLFDPILIIKTNNSLLAQALVSIYIYSESQAKQSQAAKKKRFKLSSWIQFT